MLSEEDYSASVMDVLLGWELVHSCILSNTHGFLGFEPMRHTKTSQHIAAVSTLSWHFSLKWNPCFALFLPLCHHSILFQIGSSLHTRVWRHSTHQIHQHVLRLLSWQSVVNVPLTTVRTGCSGWMWALTAILKWPLHVWFWICEYINKCINSFTQLISFITSK